MARTYTLTGILYTGQATSISNDTWESGFSTTDSTNLGSVGRDGKYYVTSILFNSTETAILQSLREKTASSITLTLTPGALERNINFLGCYKFNSTTTSWARSDKDSNGTNATDASVLFEFNPNGHTTQFTISNKTGALTVPYYGLVIGPATSNVNSRWIFTAATLTVVTTDSLTLSYNANGGSGAPSSSTSDGNPNHTFTIDNTRPTRVGYSFLGWSKSSTATTASYQPGGTITLDSNTTLYAVWKVANTIRVANGSSLDLYLVYVVENNALSPYLVRVVNGSNLDIYT